jgi:hypothetical protein
MARKCTLRTFQIENVVFVNFRPRPTECGPDQQLRALEAFVGAFLITAANQSSTDQSVASQLRGALGRILDTAGLSLTPHKEPETS